MSNNAKAGAGSLNQVGPVFKNGEIADAAVQAAQDDNPNSTLTIDDHVAYVRISANQEFIIRAKTMEEYLGRPFAMSELETVLASFAGLIETTSQHVRFYLEKTL